MNAFPLNIRGSMFDVHPSGHRMSLRLQNKIAIITGAAHGIGRAIAEQFALEGAAVLIADIDEAAGEEAAAAIRQQGRPASFARVDVTSEADIARCVALAAA